MANIYFRGFFSLALTIGMPSRQVGLFSLLARGGVYRCCRGGGRRGKQRRMGGGEGMGGGGDSMQSAIRMFYLPIK